MKQVNLRVCRMILPLLFGLFLSLSAYAQQVSVKGHVKDSTGEPVIGANVVVKDNSAQLQISVAYFCSIGLYFLV